MYDIPELEKKWKKYKRNKIKKPIIYTATTLVVIGTVIFFAKNFLNQKIVHLATTKTVKKEINKTKESAKKDSAIVITKTPIVTSKTNKTNKTNSEDGIDLSNATIVKPNVPDDDIRVIGFDNKGKKEIEKKYSDLINKPATPDPIVSEYEEKFKETQDPQYSLYLAKYFYKKGDYKKAETWAVNTNDIDGEIEDSWIIFAKSRAKQGHRVEAIKILQEYYDNTSSPKVKELLDKLRRNKPF